MNDNKVYMVRVQPELYQQIVDMASMEERSINNMANVLLRRALTKETPLPLKPEPKVEKTEDWGA